MSIYKKLLNIQKKVNGLSKDKKSFNYNYVTGNKLLGYIKPIMNDEGILLKQEITKVEYEKQTYKDRKGSEKSEILYLCEFKFTWVDCETGETDINLFQSSGMNDWDKGIGSAITYAERYFILKYFHIATDEDDIDNMDRKSNTGSKSTTKTTSTKPKTDKKPAVKKDKTVVTRTEKVEALEPYKSDILSNYEEKTGKSVSEIKFIKTNELDRYYNEYIIKK